MRRSVIFNKIVRTPQGYMNPGTSTRAYVSRPLTVRCSHPSISHWSSCLGCLARTLSVAPEDVRTSASAAGGTGEAHAPLCPENVVTMSLRSLALREDTKALVGPESHLELGPGKGLK